MALNGAHLSGASIAALMSYVSAKYGWNVSTDEALQFGAAFAVVGGGIAHLFQAPGFIPRIKQALGIGATAAK